METITPIAPDFSVSPQVRPEDMPAIAAAGFRSVLCNRPDGEEPGQPDAAALGHAALEQGLAFLHVPVASPDIAAADAQAMRAALDRLPQARSGLLPIGRSLDGIAQRGRGAERQWRGDL